MARLLVMTCGVSSMTATHGVAGECLFTITSLAKEPLQAHLRIMPLDGPAPGWFSLPGGDGLELGSGQTRQVVVQITPANVGRSVFRLDATPIAPAGERTIGPSVTVEVASNPVTVRVASRGIAWWIPVLAVVLLLIVGGGLWWILDDRSPPGPAASSPAVGAPEDAVPRASRQEAAAAAPGEQARAHPTESTGERTVDRAPEPADAPQASALARSWFAAMRGAEIDALVTMSPPPFLFDHASASTAMDVRKHYQSFTTPQAREIFAKLVLSAVSVTRADDPGMATQVKQTGLSGVDLVAILSLHAGEDHETFTLYLRRAPTLHLAGMSR